MRVIAGELRGQRLVAPRGCQVRPTSDRVREAIFSALGELGEGARVLDLYCGTGALAIEALSRGAARGRLGRSRHPSRARQPRAARSRRARRAGPGRGRSLAGERGRPRPGFDLVFVDAPYRLAARVEPELEHTPPRASAPRAGAAWSRAAPAGRFGSGRLERLRQRRYGATDVSFYRRGSAVSEPRRHGRLPGQL